MSTSAILNAHLAAGVVACLAVLVTRFFESRDPRFARWLGAIGLGLVALTFTATLFEWRLQTPARSVVLAELPEWRPTPSISSIPSKEVALPKMAPPKSPVIAHPVGEVSGFFGMVWIGFLVLRLFAAARTLLVLRGISRSAKLLDFDFQSPIYEARVPGPCLLGFFTPRILVPLGFSGIPESEQRAALAHEMAHIERGHLIDHALRESVRIPLGWFWPVQALIRAHRDAQEAECDAMAAEALGEGISLARALVRFSAQTAKPVFNGLALVPAGPSLQRRIRRLTSERKPMNINILSQGLVAAAFVTAAVAASQTLQVNERGAVPSPAKSAAALANLEVGNQWTYVYSWPEGQTSEFILHVAKKIPVQGGLVFEVENHSMSLKGQPGKHYNYMQVLDNGVAIAPNSAVSNANPGFNLASGGPSIPTNLKPGYTWRWGAVGGPNTGGSPQESAFEGKVLKSEMIDTPIGKKEATVIRVTEKVQWLTDARIAYYVPGLGKVKEISLDDKGNVRQTLTMKSFRAKAPAIKSPGYIDSRSGR